MMDFCLFVDTEADFFYKVHSPHFSRVDMLKWHGNKILGRVGRYPRNRKGLKGLVGFFLDKRLPVTFNIVGHLYLKSCNGFPHFAEVRPKADWFFKKDWYYWDKGGDCFISPGLYLGDFIEENMKVPFFCLGIHSFSHESYTLEDEDVIFKSIRAAVISARNLDVNVEVFDAPFNMIEDIKNPEKIFNVLKNNGIKVVAYSGKDDHLRKLREYKVSRPIEKYGLVALHISNYVEGTFNSKKLNNILNDMEKYLDKNVVYVLGTHDFTWRNLKNMKRIIDRVMDWERKGFVKIKKFDDYKDLIFDKKVDFKIK